MYFKRIVRTKLSKSFSKDLLELGTGGVGINLTYNLQPGHTEDLKKILMKHWHIIQQQPKVKQIFNQQPIVSYIHFAGKSKFVLMNIQMLISSRSHPSTSVNTLTTSSRGKFYSAQTSAGTGPHLVPLGNRYYITGVTWSIRALSVCRFLHSDDDQIDRKRLDS